MKNHGLYSLYIAFAWVPFLAKTWPTLKSTFRTSFERFFSCWLQWCNSQLHLSFTYQDTMCLSFDTGGQMFWVTNILYICWNRNDTKLDHCDLHEWNIKWCPFLILSPNTNKGVTNGFDSVRYSQITMHQKKWTKEIQSGRHGNIRYFPYTQNILTSNMYILTRLL